MPVPVVDLSNHFLVGAQANGNQIIVGAPPANAITPEDALVLAAWLVAIAQPHASVAFEKILELVETS